MDWREHHRQGNENAKAGEEKQVAPTVPVSLHSGMAGHMRMITHAASGSQKGQTDKVNGIQVEVELG